MEHNIRYPIQAPSDGRLFAREPDERSAFASRLRLLLSTRLGTRYRRPTFGLDMEKYLFTQQYPQLSEVVAKEIRDAVAASLPRLSVDAVTVDFPDSGRSMRVDVSFSFRRGTKTVADAVSLTLSA